MDAQFWLDEAKADREAAGILLEAGSYNLSAFHAQQAAEKALKALVRVAGENGWGHSCADLARRLVEGGLEVPQPVHEAASQLDFHYTPSRYPDALASHRPSATYTESIARSALASADVVLEFVRSEWRSR